MRKPLAIIAIVLVILSLSLVVWRVGCGGKSKNRITTNGTGIGRATPDEARLSVAVVTEAPTAQEAMAQNTEKAQAVMEALKKVDLDEKSLKTEVVDVGPKYSEPAPGEEPTIVGYTATNRVRVVTKNLDKIGEIIGAAMASGANEVDALEMMTAEAGAAQAEALKKAIKSARNKAEAAASASGRKLGKVVSIVETSTMEIPDWTPRSIYAGAVPLESEPPISPGQNDFHVEAKVVFELL